MVDGFYPAGWKGSSPLINPVASYGGGVQGSAQQMWKRSSTSVQARRVGFWPSGLILLSA